MANIIGIHGRIGSGKDTVAQMIQDVANEYYIKRFSGKLKEIVEILTGIPAKDLNDQKVKEQGLPFWDMTVRELLQRLGTEAVRDNLHKDAWVLALFADWLENSKWVIPDVRFPNEYKSIKDRGGVIIHIERGEQNGSKLHESEYALDGHLFDYYLFNHGSLDNLREQVFYMLAHFKIINKLRISEGGVI